MLILIMLFTYVITIKMFTRNYKARCPKPQHRSILVRRTCCNYYHFDMFFINLFNSAAKFVLLRLPLRGFCVS